MRMNKTGTILLNIAVLIFIVSNTAAASGDDRYIEGYASAVLEREFNISPVSLEVHDGIISLKAADIEGADHNEIVNALSGIKGVVSVQITGHGIAAGTDAATSEVRKEEAEAAVEAAVEAAIVADISDDVKRVAQDENIFKPLIADPRWPHFSVAYEHYMDFLNFNSGFAASFGESLPIYKDNAPFGGEWEFNVQAGVFILHDLDDSSSPLVNSDVIVALATSYRKDALSGLFSFFHNSSHLGDEFVLNNSEPKRINYAYEAFKLIFSYDLQDWLRAYGGGSYIIATPLKRLDHWTAQYGIEYECPRTYFAGWVRPLAAADIQQRESTGWNGEISLRAGVQIEGEKKNGHNLQFMLGYFNGNSQQGQFYENSVEYIHFGTHYYY